MGPISYAISVFAIGMLLAGLTAKNLNGKDIKKAK